MRSENLRTRQHAHSQASQVQGATETSPLARLAGISTCLFHRGSQSLPGRGFAASSPTFPSTPQRTASRGKPVYAFAPSTFPASDHTSFDSPRRDSFLRSRPSTTQTALSRRSHRDECHASGSRSARPVLHPPIVRYRRASVDAPSRAVWKATAIPLSHRGSRRSSASSLQVQAKASPRPAQIGHRPDSALYSAAVS